MRRSRWRKGCRRIVADFGRCMSGHKLLDEPTFYQRPDARRDEVETQAGGNFEEENAHEDRHEHHHLLSHPSLLVGGFGHQDLLWNDEQAIVTIGRILKYGPNQPVPLPAINRASTKEN